MLAKNTDVLSGKDYLITWKTIITNRFDSAAFKLTHADLFNQFSRSTTIPGHGTSPKWFSIT